MNINYKKILMLLSLLVLAGMVFITLMVIYLKEHPPKHPQTHLSGIQSGAF